VNPLKKTTQNFPSSPGVYLFYDSQNSVIYVGKAKNLKKRVSSYFNRSSASAAKTASMLEHCVKIDFTVTVTENEALLLEANLIKTYRPRYNVLLRDDKSYPYLCLSTHDRYPRLDLYRGKVKKLGRYFGPFPSVGAVRQNLNVLQKVFRLRQCSNAFFKSRRRPCLQHQIKRCTAPCVNKVSATDYAKQVKELELFLDGKSENLIQQLQSSMELHAEQKRYELAAEYRDRISNLREILGRQSVDKGSLNADVFAVDFNFKTCAVTILFVRGGRVLGQKTFFSACPVDSNKSVIAYDFISQYYLSSGTLSVELDRVLVAGSVSDKSWLQDALREQFSAKLKLIDNAAKHYRELCHLATVNVTEQLQQKMLAQTSIAESYELLQLELSLPFPVFRVECFDVSHTFGAATVASCVVFDERGAQKEQYRRFNITDVTAGDDYAAMKQALLRRYTRVKKRDDPMPDLLIVDGGKGQMTQALAVLQDLQISGVMILAVAKGRARKPGLEKLWVYGLDEPISLPLSSPAMRLIQSVRDEAHRFAISGHRKKRYQDSIHSQLENIPGIGAARRQALLKHFGGRQGLLKASFDELVKVPGIGQRYAKSVYLYLQSIK
jgi:excinuclease ABC subunit C